MHCILYKYPHLSRMKCHSGENHFPRCLPRVASKFSQSHKHARIQEFLSAGVGGEMGWGSRPDGQKTVWTTFFCCFFSPQPFYSLQRGSNGIIAEKTILSQGSRGDPTCSRGSNYFQGVQMLIFIETHITCDFPGEVQTPYPPPPHTHTHTHSGSAHDKS